MIYALGGVRPRMDGWHYIAPSARVIGRVRLGEDVSIWFNAVLRGDLEPIEIGAGSNVQDGSVLHTDPGAPLTVGRACTVGHMVMLHGCRIGDGCLLGIGATVLNHARIADHTLVGAHSLVTEGKEFPPGVLLLGSPAKVVRELTDEEIAEMHANAERYVANARRYATELATERSE
jgi:carbonic anhydrase/acetyltransferase-like protein (isoleucine patch superfamily)